MYWTRLKPIIKEVEMDSRKALGQDSLLQGLKHLVSHVSELNNDNVNNLICTSKIKRRCHTKQSGEANEGSYLDTRIKLKTY